MSVYDTSPSPGPIENIPGHVRISTQALQSTAKFIAAELFSLPIKNVRVSILDEAGSLRLKYQLPVLAQTMVDGAGSPTTIWHGSNAAKAVIAQKMSELTGSQVGRVDVRITGVEETA